MVENFVYLGVNIDNRLTFEKFTTAPYHVLMVG